MNKIIFGEDRKNLQEQIMRAVHKIDVSTTMIHRIDDAQDTAIFDVSTLELDNVVKLNADYERSVKGNDFASDERNYNSIRK